MSVIGLIASLTQALTLTRSVQALPVRTTSRGAEGVVAHSVLFSRQKSTQPIGERVGSPTATKAGCPIDGKDAPSDAVRSPAVVAPTETASNTAATAAKMALVLSVCARRLAIYGPFPSCWGHISHKAFVLGLSAGSSFKKN